MSSHQFRIVYRVLILGFLLIPNLCALLMARSSRSMAREFEILENAPAFSASAPFAASAEVFSPSGRMLKSLQNDTLCVAYHTRVSQSEERRTKGPDGQEKVKSESRKVAEFWNQVDDLRLRFGSREVPFSYQDVTDQLVRFRSCRHSV